MTKPRDIEYAGVSVSVRYKSVLFPIDTYAFLKALPEQGYLLTQEIEAPPLGAKLSISGQVAKKGENALRLDTGKNILAMHASDPKTGLTELGGMESVLKRDFGFDSEGNAHFYEILATAYAKAGKNALEVWQGHFDDTSFVKQASTVLGMDTTLFGVRLSQKVGTPNQEDWFDIKVTPALPSGVSHYNIEVVFRRSSRGKFVEFVQKIDSVLASLIATIEGKK
jgi:hypothetical protein